MRVLAGGSKLPAMNACHRCGDGGASDGSGPGPFSEGEAPPDSDDLGELAQACERYVERAVGIQLDSTPDTLPVLDHYVRLARASVDERPELLPVVARVVAAYFGHLICSQLGFFWRRPSPDVHTWQLCGGTAMLAINPVGVAYDALHVSAEHDGPSSQLRVGREERAAVDRRLHALPPVAEEDYFTLSTRWEVLEVAIEALRGEMLREGLSDVRFELDDYAADPDFQPD